MRNTQESEVVLVGPQGEALVQKAPGVCGGDACIGNTRIMVWLVVNSKRSGMSDEEILRDYPTLSASELAAAWEYYRRHPEEIDRAIASQEEED